MNLPKALRDSHIGDLIRHRYFMLGLGLQKGMPLLIIPLSVSVVGSGVYAQYVLIYTLVQILSVVGSLSLAQAIFPFWYENESKESLVGSLLLVMAAVEIALFAVIGVGLYFFWHYAHLDVSRTQALILILPYTFVYSLNALVLNILRLRLRQLAFFLSTAVSSTALVVFIWSLRYVHGPKLLWFTAVNVSALLVQTILYMANAGVWPRRLLPSGQLSAFVRAVLRYSWPLTLYTVLTLFTESVDKWIVRGVFTPRQFAQYVLDIQFSFALSFLSVVIGMYNSQKLCELVHLRDKAGIRSNLLGNYRITTVGSMAAAAALYVYARLGGIHLTYGFWALALAFTLCNCYMVNSGLLSAQKRSRRLVLISAVASLAYAAVLALLFIWRSLTVVYLAYLAYFVALLAISWRTVWGGLEEFSDTPQESMVLTNPEISPGDPSEVPERADGGAYVERR